MREALNNVRKHSKAHEVSIVIEANDERRGHDVATMTERISVQRRVLT